MQLSIKRRTNSAVVAVVSVGCIAFPRLVLAAWPVTPGTMPAPTNNASTAGSFVVRAGLRPEPTPGTHATPTPNAASPAPPSPEEVAPPEAPSVAPVPVPAALSREAYPTEPRSPWGGIFVVGGAFLVIAFFIRRLNTWFDH